MAAQPAQGPGSELAMRKVIASSSRERSHITATAGFLARWPTAYPGGFTQYMSMRQKKSKHAVLKHTLNHNLAHCNNVKPASHHACNAC